MVDVKNLNMVAPKSATTYRRKYFDKVALVDADFLKYLVVSDIEKYFLDKNQHPENEFGPNYIRYFLGIKMESYFYQKFNCKGMLFCFSANSKSTYRYPLCSDKEYKGNRKVDDEKYEGYYSDLASVITYVSEHHSVAIHEDYEADDLVSALQSKNTFIYSHDKDLLQVPGLHYDRKTNELVNITDEAAILHLSTQLLTGDTTDNISGVPGIGPKTTESILETKIPETMVEAALEQYILKYGVVEGFDRFCETWMLVKTKIDRGDWFSQKISDIKNKLKTLIKL